MGRKEFKSLERKRRQGVWRKQASNKAERNLIQYVNGTALTHFYIVLDVYYTSTIPMFVFPMPV